MTEYNHNDIEQKWQQFWAEHKTYKTEINHEKPKFYILDMFPYPSGAGLHVGHPLGYIASDIYARYKRLKGFNVLHPMGYDAYGLPAEQYAITTGTHPAITTQKNIKRYREQLDKIGFSYDWDREVRTCNPSYYKWTQWTFIQLFHSYYCNQAKQARPISELIDVFSKQGTKDLNVACTEPMDFTSETWNKKNEKEQQEILMNYRLAYISDTKVNWCAALGTVLANDEVKDGLSERGGYPVEKKNMRQWFLRISAYAQRLLDGLETLNWSNSIKEVQRNWIGKSKGTTVFFDIKDHPQQLEIFTTRPDTIFGSTFMVICPEHEYIPTLTTPEQKEEVDAYVKKAINRSERDRLSEVKNVTGVFSGSYAIHPITKKELPIYIADYVLSDYGSGAVMAVPAHDSRDFAFAKHFDLPIIQVVKEKNSEETKPENWENSYDAKSGEIINSDFINGMKVKDAMWAVTQKIEELHQGYSTVTYRLRDAIFSRQRYWGEPFPVYYKDGVPYTLDESELPLELPEIDEFKPTEDGQPPLARAKNWKTKEGYPLEVNTMPGFAGSSAYYYRYMDPHNENEYFSKEAIEYWKSVDLYMGGDEHATGHLIYSRFWAMFLFDLGLTVKEEPYDKLINQGKIQGRSSFAYRIKGTNQFVTYNKRKEYDTQAIYVDISLVRNDVLDQEGFRNWLPDYKNAEFITEDNGDYVCGWEIEKMSKSKYNVQNPDELIETYGADTFRLYEMFLGPIESHKPWDTQGIEGVSRFVKKFWRLYFNQDDNFDIIEDKATKGELKALHQTIKKIQEDAENFSFNTSISQFMICVNELTTLKCNKREILEPLCILISPFAPHMAEELWQYLGHDTSITYAHFPDFNEKFIKEDNIEYPISFNGKMRFKISVPTATSKEDIEKIVLEDERTAKYLDGKSPKKVIVVPKRIVNIVM